MGDARGAARRAQIGAGLVSWIVLLSLPLLPGCGVIFMEIGGGGYGVVGGPGDVRPAYGFNVALGLHLEPMALEPELEQEWRIAIGVENDTVFVPSRGRDGVFLVNGLVGRFDLTLDHVARPVFVRGTAIVTLGSATLISFADATRPVQNFNGFGATVFVGPTLTLLGDTNAHISIGPAALFGFPDAFDTTVAFGGQARLALDLGMIAPM